jgi:hypothetical protein
MPYPLTVDAGGVPPPALYDVLTNGSPGALAANTIYLVQVALYAPLVLFGVRCRIPSGGAGHYDTGIYDANGNLLAHAAASATALATASAVLTPAFLNGPLSLAPGIYQLGMWIDNVTDIVTRISGNAGMLLCQSGTVAAGPLPATTSAISGLGDSAVEPILIGIRASGGFV